MNSFYELLNHLSLQLSRRGRFAGGAFLPLPVGRPNWANYTTTTLWNTLLGTTLRLSDAHATLSDIFGKHMVQRLADMDEDANRLHRQCREMMVRCQEKVFANIAKLQSDQREYGQRQNTQLDADRICKRSEEKLTAALDYIQSKKKEPEKSQKFRRAQADYNQKYQAYESTVLATNHARNEYLIQLCAANQSIHRYFTDEVSDILDCMSCGLHNGLARAAMMHMSCEESVKNCHDSVREMINRNITALDWRADKATFLRRNEVAFSRPPAFSFLPFKDDCESEVIAVPPLRDSLAATAADLRANLDQLKTSTEEAWNNLQEIEKKLLVLINQNDYDVSELFADPVLLGRRRRRRSVSPVNGESARPVPPSPAANAGGPAAAASYTSLNKGGGGGSCGGGNTPLSSSLPPEDMGSKASVGSSGTEIQPGLYLAMRNTYREQRIREERIYMERFSAYTQEMHRCIVMQAKLAEIERALANYQSAASLKSTKRPPPLHSHLLISASEQPHCSPYLSAASGNSSGDATLPVTVSTPSSEAGPKSPFGAPPPPPPPAATTPPSTSNPNATAISVVQPAALVKMATRRVLQVPNVGRPKLFGGTIDEYVTKTGEQIPRVMLSCIRVINLYGMHHQGVFRVPGSQAEINNFKESFEYGDDPLVGLSDARDINSTAGLLKLYFRELGEPPFPKGVFMELVKTVREKRDSEECVDRLASIISCGLSHSVFIVMRYLFAFLNHLAEYSDENMMDPYNLAICFGPTLMPPPPDLDQVEFQSNVNDVVKLCINHHRRIFDPTVPGAYYEKFAAYASAVPPVLPRTIASEAVKKACSLRHQANTHTTTATTAITSQETSESDSHHSLYRPGTSTSRVTDSVGVSHRPGNKQADFSSSTDQLSIDDGLEDDNDDESDSDMEGDDFRPLHATALASFVGTSARELSFQRGAELLLYRRLNEHWWEGQAASESDGPRYLVPHLYVRLLAEDTTLTSISVRNPDTTVGVTTGKVIRHVDDDTSPSSTSKPIAASAISSPLKKPSHQSDDEEIISSCVVTLTPTLGKFSPTSYPAVTTSDSHKDATHSVSPIPAGSRCMISSTDCKIGTNNADVKTLPETDKKDSASNDRESDYAKRYTRADDNELGYEQESASTSSSSSSLMTRSMSNSPPHVSPQRRAGSRCSWAGTPTSTALVASTVPGLETLPEDRLANIRPSLRSPTVESSEINEPFKASNGSLNDVDSALAEVVRGMASLEKDRLQGPKVSTAAAQRSRELEQKMRLPSAAKYTPDLILGLPGRPQPANWGRAPAKSKEDDLLGPSKNAADTFAEQTGGTVRKRVSTQLVQFSESSKPLTTSSSLSNDLGRPETAVKPVAAAATWRSIRKLTSQSEGESNDTMSKSLVNESKSVENATTPNATDSPVPIKCGSIAARVAAFEASTSSGGASGSGSSTRPSWVKKT
ncbi:unnamed protein product [Hydatigera taeniaeformis]|uniref:SLIT-ROBO Rho GTPase-activating protein 3 n=1 Tax=Hydatigena taeniaeformis TaxID=6205 RepID=A0A0R3WIB9_HYDTA|nr:unnamed protein product [Hydatigera taeniaeformis]